MLRRMTALRLRKLGHIAATAAFLLLPLRAQAFADPFDQCIAALRASRPARSITPATWQLLDGVRPDDRVLAALNAQPEFTLPIWDYVAVMVDDERIRDGLARLSEHRATFDSVGHRYGVDPTIVAAVWGVESNFGMGRGGLPVLRSLATLSCVGRRQAYFRRELVAALRIVQEGHVSNGRFLGSWAGAFGHTQFMPSTFERLAVDFDGDGQRDIMDNVDDALASTANFLRNAGWRRGVPWGFEVRLPVSDGTVLDLTKEGRRVKRSLSTWTARGVTRVDGSELVADGLDGAVLAGLVAPAGADGPSFLVLRNFDAVYSYNAATSYALSIVHLADRLRGSPPFATAWPTDDPGLSRAERRELQSMLRERGHEIGAVDGLLTRRTREAVKVEQAKLGHEATGRPGQRLLVALRGS